MSDKVSRKFVQKNLEGAVNAKLDELKLPATQENVGRVVRATMNIAVEFAAKAGLSPEQILHLCAEAVNKLAAKAKDEELKTQTFSGMGVDGVPLAKA